DVGARPGRARGGRGHAARPLAAARHRARRRHPRRGAGATARRVDRARRGWAGDRLRAGGGGACERMNGPIDISLGEVAASLVLIAVALAVSRWRGAGLENDIVVAVFRSFVQLTAIGYVIQAIFDEDNLALVLALLVVMVGFGAFTARARARK